jgi:hypothetical protein
MWKVKSPDYSNRDFKMKACDVSLGKLRDQPPILHLSFSLEQSSKCSESHKVAGGPCPETGCPD